MRFERESRFGTQKLKCRRLGRSGNTGRGEDTPLLAATTNLLEEQQSLEQVFYDICVNLRDSFEALIDSKMGIIALH